MKTIGRTALIATVLTLGFAASAPAMPRSKQVGTPAKQESASRGSAAESQADHRHLKVGPKSKRIGG
jgi:hypothetical protein